MGVSFSLAINIINREKDSSVKLWNNPYNVGFKFCHNLYIPARVYISISSSSEDSKTGHDLQASETSDRQ